MLKNMNERKAVLRDYRNWNLYVEVPELKLRVFRAELPDKSAILACEFKSGQYLGYASSDDWLPAKFQLVPEGNGLRPSWDSESSLIEYIMRVKEEPESESHGI